jgi:hypothetical protein
MKNHQIFFVFSYNLKSYEEERDDIVELWRKRVRIEGEIKIQRNCLSILLTSWAAGCESALEELKTCLGR